MVISSKKLAALVTGASGGLGKAIAVKLALDGYTVGVHYHKNQEAAYKVQSEIVDKGGEALCFQADVGSFSSVKAMVDMMLNSLGGIDILVNNAGIRKDQLLVMMDEKDWDDVIGVNLKGIFNCSKLVAFEMLKKRKGKIINISSVGAFMGTPGQANYVASKGGIISLTKTMARELARFNILVNAVAPGFIDTDIIDGTGKIQEFIKLIPLGRIGQAEEVANLVSFLASNELSYTTGHAFYVDGGLAI